MRATPSVPRVFEVMRRDVVTVSPRARIRDALGALPREDGAALPVVDDHLHVLGLISWSVHRRRHGGVVQDVMVTPSPTIDEEAPAADAARLLLHERVGVIPVVCDDRLVGSVWRADLVAYFARHEWVCDQCGAVVRGLDPPPSCPECGAPPTAFRFEDAPPGL